MKKKILIFMLLLSVLFVGVPVKTALADEVHNVTNGVRISSNYTMDITSDGKYLYTFTLVVESDDPTSYGISVGNSVLWYGYEGDGDFIDDIRISSTDEGQYTMEETQINGVDTVTKVTVEMTYESEELYYDETEYNNFVMKLTYYGKLSGTAAVYEYIYFTLQGDVPEITPTPDPTATSTPTPTPEPSPTTGVTPEITPDVSPEVTMEPQVTLNVNVNGRVSTCTYSTGGMESVSSYFELQWFMYGKDDPDGIYDTVERVTFIDGSGTYKYDLNLGEWYRAMVSYTYVDADGVQQVKEVYSDFFQASYEDVPLAFWNLKSLMEWVWNELMEIEFTYEGFTISFKQIFLFAMIGPTLILFIVYFIGMYGVSFMFNRGGAESSDVVSRDTLSVEMVSDEQRALHDDFDI